MQPAPDRRPARTRQLLRSPGFARLVATRLLAQFGDGLFQATLAGTVLFNPQRAADPVDVAAGFAVLLLPYSVVGPFAGIWLDRWSRRDVLVRANLVRVVLVLATAALIAAGIGGPAFYGAGLTVFAVTRFLLSALSAGLPHTVEPADLVPANALSTTAGAVTTVAGGGAGVVLAGWGGAGDTGYGLVAAGATLLFLASAVAAAGFPRDRLGPGEAAAAPAAVAVGTVVRDLVSGLRIVQDRPRAGAALAAIAGTRLVNGLLTVLLLLLYRNTFTGAGVFAAGLAGLGQVLAAGAIGTLLGAGVTPRAVRRIGLRRWVIALLCLSAVAQPALVAGSQPPAAVVAGLLLGFIGQGVKICADTTLQDAVDDDHRGRVFAVYDATFNIGFVVAVTAAACWLPSSGESRGALIALAGIPVLTAARYARRSR